MAGRGSPLGQRAHPAEGNGPTQHSLCVRLGYLHRYSLDGKEEWNDVICVQKTVTLVHSDITFTHCFQIYYLNLALLPPLPSMTNVIMRNTIYC